MAYAIRFDIPDSSPVYAGKTKDSLGWALTLDTALICATEDEAHNWLKNGYGAMKRYGRIITVEEKPS